MRDIIVSAYHHCMRLGQVEAEVSFDEFFWRDEVPNGRDVAANHCAYMRTWWPEDPRIFRTTFEKLKSDPVREIRRLSGFLGAGSTQDDILRVVDSSDFEKRKSRTGSTHLRKGAVGDYESYFDQRMLTFCGELEESWRSS